jgi:hypothetical protein
MTGFYRTSIADRGYEVTPEQKAAHRHILEGVVPARKNLADLISFLGCHEALDSDEAHTLREALQVLDSLCIPMALLKEVEDPRQVAAARLFSSMLRTRVEPDPEEQEATPFRP